MIIAGVVADGVNVAPTKRQAIIVDMDGTLVDVSSIRHYVRDAMNEDGTYKGKNFDKFHKASILCPPIHETLALVHYFACHWLDVLVVTARSRSYDQVTRDWLYKHAVHYDKLFMRNVGDQRADYHVKKDILAEIRETWDVVHAIDDNPNVIRLWEEHGIDTTVVPGWEG